MDKKDFLEEIQNSVIKNRRKKFLIFLFYFSLIILFLYFIYLILGDFYLKSYLSKPKYTGIEKSFLYSNSKKAHNITKEEAIKFFTYSFIIRNEDIIDKEEYNLFLETVPSNLKFKSKSSYQIYGFLSKEDATKQAKELTKENIIKKFNIYEPKIDKELLK